MAAESADSSLTLASPGNGLRRVSDDAYPEKTQLPFRIESGICAGYPRPQLVYTGSTDVGSPPRTLQQEFREDASTSIGKAILTLIKQFYEIEASVLSLKRDKAELEKQLCIATNTEKTLRKQLAGHEAQKKRE